ncbi:alpha/beta hydrolase [Streptomyces sp. MST-110588]|uniref:alpha/beta hydrolase family protein n=1 Tax=Streptomyces sp. MST-110588 TaxID=2833628 RepID=UPI001F5CBAD3|nr:alpha/beta hydrolase [Streptomyces sp. MST-110588]UNO40282.1 alpha/beta hydrolase [Streptomyces sp. MST-110588]
MNRLRRGAVAALAALALPLASAGAASAASPALPSPDLPPSARLLSPGFASTQPPGDVRLALPRPTGPYAVGRETLHLTDRHRKDPWVPSASARELMVSMYYPARPGTGRPAAYMTTEEARLLLQGSGRATGGRAADSGRTQEPSPETVAGTRVHARTGARPVAGRHPLVVLSPGFTMNRATLSLLAEEFSSRGHVVALVDHAYESAGTSFPGGRVLTCAACAKVNAQPDEDAKRKVLADVARGRAQDVSFLLDRLLDRRHPAWRYAGTVDPRRIGMAGHSIGGNSAATAMSADHRIRAGANMDGTFFTPVPASGLGDRPFLMIGTAAGHAPGAGDTSWDEGWRALHGWKRWLTVAGSGHFTFTDLPVLAEQLGPDANDPSVPLSGRRSGEITGGYLGAFFDRHLRGVPQPLLDGPSPTNPEVTFHRP